jgi:hypothetical protein
MGFSGDGNIPPGSIEDGKFIGKLRDYQLL